MIRPTRHPLFSHGENLRIAKRVGFDPARDADSKALLDEFRGMWALPLKWTPEERERAHFYLALGIFLFIRWEDHGEPIPDDLRDWHQRYVAATASEDALYIEVEQRMGAPA